MDTIEETDDALKFAALFRVNDYVLREIVGCDSTRFALIVWCDCSDQPTHAVSNDTDSKRTSTMLRVSADILDTAEEHAIAGHA
jgi:hypothetical protein